MSKALSGKEDDIQNINLPEDMTGTLSMASADVGHDFFFLRFKSAYFGILSI